MADSNFINEINKRRTFAIISHPDAGKTTITEKLLLLGNLIQVAGTVKGRKSDRHATSDWMSMEKERGISVTSSVMQFPYRDCMVNLLDTPGHEDFSEDTYRTLTAVDSSLMVIDGAKGVEDRTIKLMDVCRLRDTPILAFVNKMDREIRDPIELLDEIESVLKIKARRSTGQLVWAVAFAVSTTSIPIPFMSTLRARATPWRMISRLKVWILLKPMRRSVTMPMMCLKSWSWSKAQLTSLIWTSFWPVVWHRCFLAPPMGNFGVREMLDDFVRWAPPPQPRATKEREVVADEKKFSGFVFKIQANMDPKHRDRIAFLRICSGKYTKGMKMKHVRTGKTVRIADAFSFKAGERISLEEAQAGDIIGLHNHGSIQIGDAFTEGEDLKFSGIPHFAPELFKRIRLADPLRAKQLQNGIRQLSEEGSTQVFFPFRNNDVIVGAVGQLQFDVVAYRLKEEYGVEAIYESVNVHSARWTEAEDSKQMESFKNKTQDNLAVDGGGHLTYLAPTRVNLSLTEERYPEIAFRSTREH